MTARTGTRRRRRPRAVLVASLTSGAALVLAAACDAGPRSPVDEAVRVDRTVPVMGTVLQVSSWAPNRTTARAANEAGWQAVARVDSLMSHYRPESEISRLSAEAGATWTDLSAPTLRVLSEALTWARRSGGAFDPTVGPLMQAWGFFQHDPRRPPDSVRAHAAELVDFRDVELDSAGRARLVREGMRVDLGALAKGYALDVALTAMLDAGATAAMVDLGGNVAVSGRGPADDGTWTLGVRHPRREGTLMGTLQLTGGAVATSGDYEQMFDDAGVRYSHIMDPRLGEPARGVVAVTVAAPDGMTADALSTVLFVLGPDEGRALLDREGFADKVTAVWVLDHGDAPAGTDGLPGSVIVHQGREATLVIPPR